MHPYKTTDRTALSCILGLTFLDHRPEDEDSELNSALFLLFPWSLLAQTVTELAVYIVNTLKIIAHSA
jgi:hypothetical protein